MFLWFLEQLRILYAQGSKKSKLFINSKVSLGLESVFLKCLCIWRLYYNLTDAALDDLQIEAHLKDGRVLGWPCVTSLQTALVIRPWR